MVENTFRLSCILYPASEIYQNREPCDYQKIPSRAQKYQLNQIIAILFTLRGRFMSGIISLLFYSGICHSPLFYNYPRYRVSF